MGFVGIRLLISVGVGRGVSEGDIAAFKLRHRFRALFFFFIFEM